MAVVHSSNTRSRCDTSSVQRPSIFLSPYWRGSLYYTLFWALIAIFAPFINLHWQMIGVTNQQLGYLSAVGPLMVLLLAPMISRLADLNGKHRELLGAALFGSGAAIFGLGFAKDFLGVVIGSVALGIAACAFGSLADGLIARMASRRRLEFGRMRLWGSVSFALFSLAFGWLWSRVGYGGMLFVTGALMMLMTPFGLLLEADQSDLETPSEARGLTRPPQIWNAGLYALLGVNLLIGFALGFVGPFLGVRMKDLGGGALEVGALFAISALSEFPAMRFEKRIAARIGDAGVLIVASAMFAFSYLGYALAPNAGAMLAFAVVQGTAFGLFFVASVRTIDSRAGALLGTMQSWRNALAFGIAPLIAGPLGGWVAQSSASAWVFAAASAFGLLAALLMWLTRSILEPARV